MIDGVANFAESCMMVKIPCSMQNRRMSSKTLDMRGGMIPLQIKMSMESYSRILSTPKKHPEILRPAVDVQS